MVIVSFNQIAMTIYYARINRSKQPNLLRGHGVEALAYSW